MRTKPPQDPGTVSNTQIAELTGLPAADVELAFANYNRLVDALGERSRAPVDDLLKAARDAGIEGIDAPVGQALIKVGTLKASLGELAAIPGVGLGLVRSMIPGLTRLEVPSGVPPETERHAAVRRVTPRSRVDPMAQLAVVSAIGARALGAKHAFLLPDDWLDLIEELGEELETVGDALSAGKEVVKEGGDLLKELKKVKKTLEGKSRAPQPSTAGGGTLTHPETPEEINGQIEEDEYARIIGEDLNNEPLYTVWLDRPMAFEVDGAGDDNVYMTVQCKVYLRDPPFRISSSFVTAVYDIDERQEYRLKPKTPTTGRRDLPLGDEDWGERGFLETRDAALALRVNDDVRGIPQSRLDKVEVSVYLYENDDVEELLAAVAALGAAAIAALGIIKGKFTAPAGSISEATDGVQRALNRLNRLINSDDKVIEDQFTFTPDHFRTAFTHGQTFPVRQRNTTAACGMDFQRIAGAKREKGDVLDTEAADAVLALATDAEKGEPSFWEDEFDSFYELRVRFEREERS